MSELVTKTVQRSACPICKQVFEHDPAPADVWLNWECHSNGTHRISTMDNKALYDGPLSRGDGIGIYEIYRGGK